MQSSEKRAPEAAKPPCGIARFCEADGRDDRRGDRVIIEATTESVDPLGQISPFRVHKQVGLLGPARAVVWPVMKPVRRSYGL